MMLTFEEYWKLTVDVGGSIDDWTAYRISYNNGKIIKGK
jgi:hypothetical protein